MASKETGKRAAHLFDYWEDLRGEYEEPTENEYTLIAPYVRKAYYEKDDFVEDENWRSLEETTGIPNLRPLLLKTLHQIRESKGYDVESTCGRLCHFIPANESSQMRIYEAMKAARFAITTINSETEKMKKAYQLVSVENFVDAFKNRCYLLTLTVEEVVVDGKDVVMAEADAGDALKSIRAIVFVPSPVAKYELLEWKFK